MTRYSVVYTLTFALSIVKAFVCFMSMIGWFSASKTSWLIVLILETLFLVISAVNYDDRFPAKSPNHNVYRTYILTLLAIVLTVFVFMMFAACGLIIPEVAIMTYLYFCLPIWLNFLVSFFVLQETCNK